MKKILFAFLFLAVSFALCLEPALSLTEPLWVDGSVTSSVSEDIFDTEQYWVFNFSVTNTNRTDLVELNQNIQVLCPKNLSSNLVQGGFYNFSGVIVDVQTTEKPQGSFVVSQINVKGYSDWVQVLIDIITVFSGLVSGIAYGLGEVIFIVFGVVVPELVITAVIIAALAWLIISHLKTLSLLLVIVIFFLLVSGGFNVIRLLFLT